MVARRRVWFWRFWLKVTVIFVVVGALFYAFGGTGYIVGILPLLVIFPFYMIFNFAILFGPLLLMNLSQIQAFEPGDAEWGVKLADVRGQAEAKEEVRRVCLIWQSGDAFERAGGKRERGLLFLGAPGTGKTMLAKALATGFNSPFISIPGSGFAATFIGIDAIIVRILARRAKRLARKWGGQCIVFIDEIDAVGMRRQALNPGFGGAAGRIATAGRSRLPLLRPVRRAQSVRRPHPREPAVARAPVRRARTPVARPVRVHEPDERRRRLHVPGRDGRRLAGAEPAARRDGRHRQPAVLQEVLHEQDERAPRRDLHRPAADRERSFRIPAARPRREQIYFIGATNVPVDRLDPALTRPGRMGRHVWFRTPTKQDRLDVLDLYLGKVAHEPELDQPHKREEIARVTNGYAPAMLEQVTSMALTIAHHSDRDALSWDDLVEAMTTLEAGTAVGIEYIPEESRAVAIHEAGHAAAGHVYLKGAESTRLSIRMRGGALGHHQALEKEERFSRFRSEEFARLVWALGAMAAERVFYGENSNGVGGDVMSVTAQAAYMVGASAMGPEPFAITPREDETDEEARERILKRFEKIGLADREPHGRRRAVLGEPDRNGARRPRQARDRRPARRAGVRRCVQPHRRESRCSRPHRRRARRTPRALRRRVAQSARRVEDHDSGRRSLGGELVADDVMDKAATEAKPVPGNGIGATVAPRESRAERARRVAYRNRFAAFYVLLAIIAGAGVGALLVLVGRGSPAPAPAWSAWEPVGSSERRAAQIGDHVGDQYRLPSGNALGTVTYAGPPTVTGPDGSTFQVRAIAIRPDTTAGRAEADDIDTVNAGNTVMYTICGLGTSCSIAEGKPTVARGQLLRREALELALYSFHSLDGIDSTLVLLPPRADGKAATAVFVERSDVRSELGRPLQETLTAPLTPGVGEIRRDEQRVVDRTTRSRLYEYSYLQAQDGSPVMVLTPALSG